MAAPQTSVLCQGVPRAPGASIPLAALSRHLDIRTSKAFKVRKGRCRVSCRQKALSGRPCPLGGQTAPAVLLAGLATPRSRGRGYRGVSRRKDALWITYAAEGAVPVGAGLPWGLERLLPRELQTRFKDTAFGNPKFFPMVLLFFFMSFINTILDSLASSLVITAQGGGTQVIPFLTVYAVWPCSFLFLMLYSFASQRFSRAALFNLVVVVFLAFYACFGLLFPQHHTLHLHSFAEDLLKVAPAGLAGAVGMVRNYMFTLFYCSAELWGDVVLSLLFWGLANETTSMGEAPLLYPLFGIGANLGQALSGRLLSMFSSATGHRMSYATQMQLTMGGIVAFGCMVLALHAHIVTRFPASVREANAADRALDQAVEAGRKRISAGAGDGVADPAAAASVGKLPKVGTGSRPKLSLGEAIAFLAKSLQIQCLAVMALAQGLSTSLIELAWKSHLHMLHPSPAAYAAFMGDVAMWTGIVTGSLMLVSPALFRAWKWRGVARATPTFLRITGLPFFLGCIGYALLLRSGHSARMYLQCLVVIGALLQVFGKGAKFSMFKPAEEMVYIALDEQSRTKGKAAIDVVGAQTGKSLASMLQQVLLVAMAGSMTGTLPLLAVAYYVILVFWTRSVDKLDQLHVCAFSDESQPDPGPGAALKPIL